MSKTQVWLGGLLVSQCILATGLFVSDRHAAQSNVALPLLSFAQAQVGRVVISDSDNTVTLSKSGDRWVLPDLQALPANQRQLTDVFEKLSALQAGWPVATTSSSQARFEVSDEKFQRRIQLYQGDDLVEDFFVGTSPGFRKVHVRQADDDAIYSVLLNSYELPAQGDQWLDKTLLGASAVTAIKAGDYALKKTGDDWHFEPPEPQANSENSAPEIDAEKAAQLASAFTTLRVQGWVDKPDPKLKEATSAAFEITGSAQWHYDLLALDEQYYIRRNDRDLLFKLSQSDYEKIVNITQAQLVKTVDVEEGADTPSDG